TVPTATPAPTSNPTRIKIARARRCFAGAITAPAGLEAVTPAAPSGGAAAVPTGFWEVCGCSGLTAGGAADGFDCCPPNASASSGEPLTVPSLIGFGASGRETFEA